MTEAEKLIDDALSAAADSHGGYMNATKKKAVKAAINIILSKQDEAVERAFKNGWACGYMSGGKDAHPGAPGKTCAEDLAAYKKKVAE